MSETVKNNQDTKYILEVRDLHTAFSTDVNVASMLERAFEATAAFAAGRPCPCEVPL